MKDDESSIRDDTRDCPVIAQICQGLLVSTDESLASDLRSGSAAGTDLEWVMTRFRLDLVTVISISKLSVKTTSISLVSPNTRSLPQYQKHPPPSPCYSAKD